MRIQLGELAAPLAAPDPNRVGAHAIGPCRCPLADPANTRHSTSVAASFPISRPYPIKGSTNEANDRGGEMTEQASSGGRFISGGSPTFDMDTGEKTAEGRPDRVYVRSYTERVDIVVTEKDAREHMDPGDEELTDEHWEKAARYLTPEQFESCGMDRWR